MLLIAAVPMSLPSIIEQLVAAVTVPITMSIGYLF
jgi:hypothetical protein